MRIAEYEFLNEPVRIGYSLSLTGPDAERTWSARLAHQLWQEQINARGGLLGRKVELICIDDQSDPSIVPAIYRQLIDGDKVDLLLSAFGSTAASLPVTQSRGRLLIGLMSPGVNAGLHYEHYFAMVPTGPDPATALIRGFFELAAKQDGPPRTVALLTGNVPYPLDPAEAAKRLAASFGMMIVLEKKYDHPAGGFRAMIDEIRQSNAEILFVCSSGEEAKDLVRALYNSSYRPGMAGGMITGPQCTAFKAELGSMLNGLVIYDYWLPVAELNFQGSRRMLSRYRKMAAGTVADKLGTHVALLAYAQLQVLEQAVESTGTIENEPLSFYCRNNFFDTVVGRISFGKDGEWSNPRVLQIQFQHIEDADLKTLRDGRGQTVVYPEIYASGKLIYPYDPGT